MRGGKGGGGGVAKPPNPSLPLGHPSPRPAGTDADAKRTRVWAIARAGMGRPVLPSRGPGRSHLLSPVQWPGPCPGAKVRDCIWQLVVKGVCVQITGVCVHSC